MKAERAARCKAFAVRLASPRCRALISALCTAIIALGTVSGSNSLQSAEVYRVAPDGVACTSARCTCSSRAPCGLSPALTARLQPGDVVLLAGGRYAPVTIVGVQGARYAPIVMRAADDREPPVFDGYGAVNDVIEIRKSAFVELGGLAVHGAARAGIWLNNSHNITVRDSLIQNSGVWGVFTNHSNGVTVSGNHILGPAEQHGIYLSNSGDGGRLENNLILDFNGCGIQLNGDKRMAGDDQVIGDGVIEDVVIKGNYIAGSGRAGGAAINLDGARNTRVIGNILVENRSAAIAMFRGDGAVASRETQISANLIVGALDSRALIVMADGAVDQLLTDNLLVGLNPDAALISVAAGGSDEEQTGIFAWFKPVRYALAATFIANRYAAAGPIAEIPERETLSSLGAWADVAADSESTLLPIAAMELAAMSPQARYRRLVDYIDPSSALASNPYFGRLRDPEANALP